MSQVTVRETSAELPDLPAEAELARVESLDAKGGLAWRFALTGTRYRALDLSGMRLLDGRVRSVHGGEPRKP